MKPLLKTVVAISLFLAVHALPENIEDVKELPQSKEPVVEAEESQPQARVERCTTCTSLNIKLKSPREVFAALKALPGAEVHTQQSFQGCSSDKGCAGLKIKDGRWTDIIERFGNADAFNAAAAADVNNEFNFQAAGFGNNVFEGLDNPPFWWMNQDSPFKAGGASGSFKKFSESSSSSFSGGGAGGITGGIAGTLDLGANPFLNGDFSKLAADIKPSYQSSAFESSYSTSNNGEVDLSKNPFLNGGFKAGQGFQSAFEANAAAQKFGAGAAAQNFGAGAFVSGNKAVTGYVGSSPAPFVPVGANVNLIQNGKTDFDFQQQQQTQQNIDEIFQSSGNVGVEAQVGDLEQTCAADGYSCVLKSLCNNGVAFVQVKVKKQYCNVRTEVCCRIEVALASSQGSFANQGSVLSGQAGYGVASSIGKGAYGSTASIGSGIGAVSTGSVGYGAGSTLAPTTSRFNANGFKSSGANFIETDALSSGSEVAGVYRPGAIGSNLKPGIPYLPPVDNPKSGTNIVSSTVFPIPTFVTSPRPIISTGRPTYLPPVSSTSAPGYLPPIGEQTINRETIVPPSPNYEEGSIILDENRPPRIKPTPIPVPVPVPVPSDIPAGCAAALKCTPIEFCTAEGVISNTTVILTRDQDAYRVPLTDCRDIETGRIGKCCRDPFYTDPWPTNQLGKWVPGVFGGNDGKYVPDSRVSPNNIQPTITARPPVTGSLLLNNFMSTKPPVSPFNPNQVSGFPSSTPFPVKGQFGQGGVGIYGQGGQGQFGIAGQGSQVNTAIQKGQGQIRKQGQGQFVSQGQGSANTQGFTTGTGIRQGQGVGVVQGQGVRQQGGFISQGQGAVVSQGAGQYGVGGQGSIGVQGQGVQSQFGVGQKVGFGQGVSQGQGLGVINGQGVAINKGQGQIVSQGQGQFASQGQGVGISQGFGSGVRQGQGVAISQGQGVGISQGFGSGVRQGQGVAVSQGQGLEISQGFGSGVRQGQGDAVAQGQGLGVSQGFGAGVQQGLGAGVSQGFGQGIRQGQGQFVSQGEGIGVSQGFGSGVRQGQGHGVIQGQGQIVSEGQGLDVSQGFGQGIRRGQGQFVSQGQGELVSQGEGTYVSQGFGQGIRQGQGQFVSQGQGQYVTQGQGRKVIQGFGQAIRQGSGVGVENEYSESVNRVFLQQYNGGGQCGLLNGQKPSGNRKDLEVDFAEIPWQAMVLLQTNRSLLCGGVITRPDVVVTSAACVEGLDAKNVLIKGGEWKLGIDDEPLPFQIVQVKTILRHPLYKPGSFLYDAAILVLTENLRLAKNIYPICLPGANENLDAFYSGAGQCIVTGWGKQVLQAHLAGSIMHSLNVSLISPGECQAKLSSDYPHLLEQYDGDSCDCGQPSNPLNNICRVDIGSALACTSGDGHFVLRGVYSWDSGCQVGNQIAAFYRFDLEWYQWAIGLIESVRFAKFSTVTKVSISQVKGVKGFSGVKGSQFSGVKGSVNSGSVSSGSASLGVKGFGVSSGKGQVTFGQTPGFVSQKEFAGSVNQFSDKISSSGSSQAGFGDFNFSEIKPISNGFSATYSEKKVFQTEPKIVTFTTKPEIVTYTTKPEIVTFTTKPEFFTYTTKPKIITYTTKPEIITYTTKPKIVTFTTKPQIIRYETSGSGTNPQYVAPGITFNPSFSDLIGKHEHSAKCKCLEGKK